MLHRVGIPDPIVNKFPGHLSPEKSAECIGNLSVGSNKHASKTSIFSEDHPKDDDFDDNSSSFRKALKHIDILVAKVQNFTQSIQIQNLSSLLQPVVSQSDLQPAEATTSMKTMQHASVVLFVSSVMLVCIASSTEEPGPNVTVANLPGSMRLSTSDINRVPAVQLQGPIATTDQEERILSPLTPLMEKLRFYVVETLGYLKGCYLIELFTSAEGVMKRYHPRTSVEGDTYKLAQDFWDRLTQLDLVALKMIARYYHDDLRTIRYALVKLFSSKYGVSEMTEVLLKAQDSDTTFRSKFAKQLLSDQLSLWEHGGTSAADVFVQIKRPGSDEVTVPQWRLFFDYVSRLVVPYGHPHTFDTVAKDLAGVDGILPVLAQVKTIHGRPGVFARFVERAIAPDVAKEGDSFQEYLSLLNLRPADFFEVDVRNVVNKILEDKFRSREKEIHLFSALREYYGDVLFFEGILEAQTKKHTGTQDSNQAKEWLFEQWSLEMDNGSDVKRLLQKIRESGPEFGRQLTRKTATKIASQYAAWSKNQPT